MYRVYADDPQARINLGIRRRLAPLLGNDRRKIELMNALLFSLPGTPVLYYGDEIGMGDNIYLGDRNGVRTPMQWSADRNAGFSRANPQRLYLPRDHRPRVPLRGGQRRGAAGQPALAAVVDEAADRAAQALSSAFGRGTLEFLHPRTARCSRSSASYEDETDPGRRQPVALRPVRRARPVRVQGDDAGRAVRPHRVSRRSASARTSSRSGPHAFYWFALERRAAGDGRDRAGPAPAAPAQSPDRPGRASSTAAAARRSARALAGVPPHAALVRRQGARRSKRRPIARRHPPSDGRRVGLHSRSCSVEYTEGDAGDLRRCRLPFAAGDRATAVERERRAR